MAAQGLTRRIIPLQLLVGQGRVDGAVADWVDGNGLPPAAAFRNRMVPFDAAAERALAQKAAQLLRY